MNNLGVLQKWKLKELRDAFKVPNPKFDLAECRVLKAQKKVNFKRK